MKRMLLVLVLALLTLSSASAAIQLYNPSTNSYAGVRSWEPTYITQPRYTGELGRPEGYGLLRQQAPYPRQLSRYCENNDMLGHTSAWSPGRFYSGINGYRREAPRYRSQSDRCPPTSRLSLNTFRWNY